MNPGGRKPTRHLIDGREMTVAEIADMLGVTARALQCRRSRMGGVRYQLIVDMYRSNQLLSANDKWPRHMVHGRWLSIAQAAEELGVPIGTLKSWRERNRDAAGRLPTLEAAYDCYMHGRPERGGRVPKLYCVNGRQLSVAQAAERYKVTPAALYLCMHKHRCSLHTAVRRCRAAKQKRAEKEILKILGF